MAKTKKKAANDNAVEDEDTPAETEEASVSDQSEEEFEAAQAEAAQKQGLPPGAVPEQRPQAFTEVDKTKDEISQRLEDEGQGEKMDKSAYEAAQAEPDTDAEQQESVRVGAYIKITDGPYEGANAVVNEVQYDGPEEAAKARSGDPAAARFAKVATVLARTRGGKHALVELTPEQFEYLDATTYTRGPA